MSDHHTMSSRRTRGMGKATRVVVQYLILFAFWLVLSGQYNALFIGMGAVSAAVVTALTHDMVSQSFGPTTGGLASFPVRAWRFLGFAGWVLAQIPWAGLQIAHFVLHPRMPVQPCVLRFRTSLESQVARTLLANTITLIPGTLTVAVEDGEFTVHAFAAGFADDLVTGRLQNRIARVFLQEPDESPAVVWERGRQRTEEVVG